MDNSDLPPIARHMDCIKDPRHHNVRHLLQDILIIALCGIISGADNWVLVAEYGRSKEEWFKQFLLLPNGIASHDTFGRLFAKLDPKEFKEFFARWVQDISCSEYAGIMQYAGVHGGGSPRMEQIAILGSYDVERTKNIAKRLAGIPVKEGYRFDRLGTAQKP